MDHFKCTVSLLQALGKANADPIPSFVVSCAYFLERLVCADDKNEQYEKLKLRVCKPANNTIPCFFLMGKLIKYIAHCKQGERKFVTLSKLNARIPRDDEISHEKREVRIANLKKWRDTHMAELTNGISHKILSKLIPSTEDIAAVDIDGNTSLLWDEISDDYLFPFEIPLYWNL